MISTSSARAGTREMVSLKTLKHRFAHKFPNSEITQILLLEPPEISIESFISKAETWLVLIDVEQAKEFRPSLSNEKGARE